MEGGLIIMVMCATIYAIVHIKVRSKHKEKMALIAKSEDTKDIFSDLREQKSGKSFFSIYLLICLELAMILIGIGIGVLIGNYLSEVLRIEYHIAMSSSVTLSIGVSLLIFYIISIKKNTKSVE